MTANNCLPRVLEPCPNVVREGQWQVGKRWDVCRASIPPDLRPTGFDVLCLDSRDDTGDKKEEKGRTGKAAERGCHYLGAFLAQQHNDAQVACRRGIAQRSQAAFRRGIHIGPKLQQQGYHFCVTKMRLDTQNWSII